MDLNSVTGLIFTRLMIALCISEVWPYLLTNPALTFSGRHVFLLSSVSVFTHWKSPNVFFWPLPVSSPCFSGAVTVERCRCRCSEAPDSLVLFPVSGGPGQRLSEHPDRYFTPQTLLVFLGVNAFCQLLPPIRSSVISPPVCNRFPSTAILAASLPPSLTRDGGGALYYCLVFSAADGLVTGIIKSAR